jgi:glycosyltransferase involved in cell wall biosynthesis
MTDRRRRLLTIGHSYCVGLNRRLPHELSNDGWDVTVVGPARFRGDFGWHTLEADADEPCRVVPVPVTFGRRIHVMRYGGELSSLLRERWDLVHCWEEPYIAAAGQIARQVDAAVPLVFATFQNIEKRYPPPFNLIERYALKRADGIVAFGETIAEVINARGVFGGPMAVIAPGVDLRAFKPDAARRAETLARLRWDEGIPVVGFVGRLVPEKGLDLFMSALENVTTPWRALIVGTGPLEEALVAWSHRQGDRVRVVTTARHDEVPALMNAMDVLCAPSRTTARWREQFGRMLIEAFASGVAVIASTSGEIPHVVGDAGLVLPEDDRPRWQQAIEALTTDRARRCDLARRGRDRAVSLYGWQSVARRHTAFFERVIAGRPS